jgi:CBS-domain-containing membrane protein
VIEQLALQRIHRVFILDTAPNALLSVVTHTDVLTAVLHQHNKPQTIA